ncbi:MAG: hypothetical protein D6730_17115 [Bacteroidetes bacterium]|nr:MAG: hypothetical protein D6730_17115 [Bacteroidota bacterium]
MLLRLPALVGGFYMHEESLLMLCAQRLQEGGSLYTDAWYSGPPLMVWIYYLFLSVFGKGALTAIRLFGCLYVYLTAVYFSGMLVAYKPYKRFTVLPAFLFVFLVSTPWYIQEFSPALFCLLPITIAFHSMIRLDEQRTRAYSLLFQAGLLMGLCLLAAYKTIFVLAGLILTYLFLKRPRSDELISLIGGVWVVLAIFGLQLYFSGSMADYLDVGLLYYWQRLGLGTGEMYHYFPQQSLYIWLLAWSTLIFFALLGYVHFRLKFYSYVVKIRSLESTMSLWLLAVSATILFKLNRLELQDFILLIPPVVFYANRALEFSLAYRLRLPLLVLSLLMPLYMYASYWGLVFPHQLPQLRPSAEQHSLHGGFWQHFNPRDPLMQYFRERNVKTLWVMDDDPALYLRLGAKCANKYTDFRIAYNKFPVFRQRLQHPARTKAESESEIFRQFSHFPAQYIIDPHKNFTFLQQRFPSLLGKYQPSEVGETLVYSQAGMHLPAF